MAITKEQLRQIIKENEKHSIETDNKRNGHTPKTVKSEFGEFQLDIPRDRNGEFEPEIVPKYCHMCIKYYPRSGLAAPKKKKRTLPVFVMQKMQADCINIPNMRILKLIA